MEYIQITIENISQETSDQLVALLQEIGFEGFEEDESILKAFILSERFDQKSFDILIEQNILKYSKSIIKETNWNQEWESGFEPVSIYSPKDNRLFVHLRAHFHPPNPNALFDLIVTPKMSFGTGHHATTYLMIQQMADLDFNGKSVIDYGTGTGVLAILAEKLGAKEVLGIDNDEWSISNATENIEANNCSKITLVKADTCFSQEKVSVILANINLNIIKENLPSIKNCLNQSGTVLFSGILNNDLQEIEKAIKSSGLSISEVLERDNWLLIKAIN